MIDELAACQAWLVLACAMPKAKGKRLQEPGNDLEKWKQWAKSEYNNEGKFWSNMVSATDPTGMSWTLFGYQ